jgi:pimeloyl-ACP methyl ester carboxylesterase
MIGCGRDRSRRERGGYSVPFVTTNGIRLAYERTGQGKLVLLIMGSGAAGRVWSTYQTPALHQAGYQAVTFDNRGIPPSDVPPGMSSLADVVADTVGLIEALDAGPCRVVGASMGAAIAQELAAARPDLVECAVLIAPRARADAARRALAAADATLAGTGIRLPASYRAAMSVFLMLSPRTLNDDASVSAWLDVFELSGVGTQAGAGQAGVDLAPDRRGTLGGITVPCRVIAFTDDLICPPRLSLEVADTIPDCDFVEIGSCGHLGYLERPDEVNSAIIEFLDKN